MLEPFKKAGAFLWTQILATMCSARSLQLPRKQTLPYLSCYSLPPPLSQISNRPSVFTMVLSYKRDTSEHLPSLTTLKSYFPALGASPIPNGSQTITKTEFLFDFVEVQDEKYHKGTSLVETKPVGENIFERL